MPFFFSHKNFCSSMTVFLDSMVCLIFNLFFFSGKIYTSLTPRVEQRTNFLGNHTPKLLFFVCVCSATGQQRLAPMRLLNFFVMKLTGKNTRVARIRSLQYFGRFRNPESFDRCRFRLFQDFFGNFYAASGAQSLAGLSSYPRLLVDLFL